ncbi:uncharacterized protein LOC126798241 [Argentina anserina]|uniref:uncharacterized protein LOC126798241 n=1 Tax=Argentina anserina TaxID=57926 RepID=UPI0021764BD4|nr:uncharacterized protein LOC126798241 [Potentilla anserina]XP_050381105.1 uncharacterized protein LOC126798241 [Potentilla anserina]
MECNKDEAVRAMQLAQKKIQNKDFKGAKEMAMKAQRLYPQLDNISQLITVCEVLLLAERKIGGSEMDWYGILQSQQSDDVEIIKEKRKKLTLVLHPDKNRFDGADAAFKLVMEAWKVLSDKGSRSKYDIKCSTLLGTGTSSFGYFGPKYSSAASSVPQSRYTSVNLQQPVNIQQPVQPETIRIACPSCKRTYDYDFANRLIFCQRCLGIFDASDLGSQSNGGTGNPSSTTLHNRNATSKVARAAEVGGASKTVKRDIENGVGIEKQGVERSESSPLKSKDSRKLRNTHRKRGETSTRDSGDYPRTGKGAKADSEVVVQEKVSNPSEARENHTRRSSRNVHSVSFCETLDDDGDNACDVNVNGDANEGSSKMRENSLSTATKRKRINGSAGDGVYRPTVLALFAMDGYEKLVKQRVRRRKSFPSESGWVEESSMADGNGSKSMADDNFSKSMADDNCSKSMLDGNCSKSMLDGNCSKSMLDGNGSKSIADANGSKPMTSMRKINEVPQPEFHKFALSEAELLKTFKANQTWVLYDPADGMPRRYACIRKVLRPGFKVKITWLQADPDDQGEVDWCKKFPVACGKFGFALTEEVTDHTMFSHEYIHSIKGKDKSSFRIYPRKGETWALYQDWDLGWSSEPEKHSQYKFDFVELLSDFSERGGAEVSYLGKVRGFHSLFQPAEQHGAVRFQVLPNELYRFSHQIPSRTMTGCEGYGVPEGSFEFDPASLPASLFDRRSIVTVAKPSSFIPSGRARPATKQVKKDPERGEDKKGNLNGEPIVID